VDDSGGPPIGRTAKKGLGGTSIDGEGEADRTNRLHKERVAEVEHTSNSQQARARRAESTRRQPAKGARGSTRHKQLEVPHGGPQKELEVLEVPHGRRQKELKVPRRERENHSVWVEQQSGGSTQKVGGQPQWVGRTTLSGSNQSLSARHHPPTNRYLRPWGVGVSANGRGQNKKWKRCIAGLTGKRTLFDHKHSEDGLFVPTVAPTVQVNLRNRKSDSLRPKDCCSGWREGRGENHTVANDGQKKRCKQFPKSPQAMWWKGKG
jgi:hypothetical protein